MDRRVALADLAAGHREHAAEIEAAVLEVLRSGRYILGPEVEAFERELAEFTGVPHAVGVASGSDALLLALKALELPPESKVVVPTFTFFASASCCVRLGYTPVFVDSDPASLCLDEAAAARAAQDPAVAAVIAVDLYGDVVDYDRLRKLIGRPEVKLIEDAAQSFGAELRGRKAGSLADAAIFSFFPAKNLGAAGDGGAVLTADAELAERVRVLRVHGSKPKYRHHVVGYNSRLDPLQAALLRVKLRGIERDLARRRELAARYAAGFGDLVTLPAPEEGHRHGFNYYVVQAERRDELAQYLKEAGIATAVYYPEPLHRQPCFAGLVPGSLSLPAAEAACSRVLALPMYPQLSHDDQDYVIARVREFYGR